MRRVLALFLPLILVVAGFLGGCSQLPDPWPSKPGKRVLATFPPIYCFARNVAGDDAVVLCLLAAKGPHDANEWSPQDMLKFRGADLVLANGLGLDENIIGKLKASANKKVEVVELGECIPDDKLLLQEEAKEQKPGSGEDGHKHTGKHDPHVWLSPELAMVMVDRIADELSKLDPAHKTGFHDRAAAYKEKLKKELIDYGADRFKNVESRNIVSQHDALRYFARSYNLKIVGYLRQQEGLTLSGPEQADLKKLLKEKHVRVITFEPQFDRNQMEQLRKSGEVNAELVDVDPLETAPIAKDSSDPDPRCYIDVMRKNIDNLAEKLK